MTQAAVFEPRPQPYVRRQFRAVEQHAVAGPYPAENIDRCSSPMRLVFAHRSAASMEVRRHVSLRPALFTDQPADVFQRRLIGDTSAEKLRPMVIQEGLGTVAIASPQLRKV